MRRVLMLALPLLLAGCQSGAVSAAGDTASVKSPVELVGDPKNVKPTDIALLGERQFVTVGMTADDAFKAFPRTAGYEFDQNPPGFGANYRSQHWEDGRQHGFGVILFRNAVVGAMYQEENATPERVDQFVARHRERLGEPADVISGRHVTYWFWERDGQRLMISAYASQPSGVQLTAAMGDDVVMDGIAATPRQASLAKSLTERTVPAASGEIERKG